MLAVLIPIWNQEEAHLLSAIDIKLNFHKLQTHVFLFISLQPVNHCRGDRLINRCLWDGNYSSWILHQPFPDIAVEIHCCLPSLNLDPLCLPWLRLVLAAELNLCVSFFGKKVVGAHTRQTKTWETWLNWRLALFQRFWKRNIFSITRKEMLLRVAMSLTWTSVCLAQQQYETNNNLKEKIVYRIFFLFYRPVQLGIRWYPHNFCADDLMKLCARISSPTKTKL